MKKSFLFGATLFGLLLIFSINGAAVGSVVVDRVVAVVNNEVITMSDLQRASSIIEKNGKAKMDERLILDGLIDQKLQIAAAKKAGVDVTDAELDEIIAGIKKRKSMNDRQFEAAIAEEEKGLTIEQYRARLREEVTLSKMMEKQVRSGLKLDDTEIRAYYDRNVKSYTLPEEIRVRHIFFKTPEGASQSKISAVKSKAESVYERAQKGEDFIELVRRYSEAETASQDGDLGFMQREHALPEIEKASRGLKTGETAGPLRCSTGFHIIRLEEMRTPVKPFEKVRDEIAQMLFMQKMDNTYRAWLQTLRSESHIENLL